MKEKPQILSNNVVAQSKLFHIEEVHLQFQNGEERIYERLRGGRRFGAVMIVPVLNQETLILIREYAVGTDRYELAFPKGLIEPNEEPIEAANRELMEEAGFGARRLEPLRVMSTNPGYMGGEMQAILATDLYPQRRPGDEPEPIEVVQWPLTAISELLAQPDFTEARSIAALFLCLQHLKLS